MARWQEVAAGTNIFNLQSTIGELELPKGSRLKIVMDLKFPVAWIFDVAGAELIFKPFVPEGMDLIDVYGEGNQGIVEMEVTGTWLIAILAFVRVHWLAITIATFVLTTIIASVIVLVKIAAAPGKTVVPIAIIGGLALFGILAVVVTRKGGVLQNKLL